MKTYKDLIEKFSTSKDSPLVKAYYDKGKKKIFAVTDYKTMSEIHGFDAKKYLDAVKAGDLVQIPGDKANKEMYIELSKKL